MGAVPITELRRDILQFDVLIAEHRLRRFDASLFQQFQIAQAPLGEPSL